jgi:hypothetical protein
MMRWLRVKLLMHFAPVERNPNTRLGLKLHKVQNVQVPRGIGMKQVTQEPML